MSYATPSQFKVSPAANGFIVDHGGQISVALTLEAVMDLALQHFEGRFADGLNDVYGTVVILRCKCFQTNQDGLSRTDAIAGCSKCSERLALLV